MKFTTRVKNALLGVNTTNNDIGNQAADFLRYGNKNQPLLQDWSQVEMSDQDMYTGYSYAAINKRANRAAVLGKKFLYTEASPAYMEAARTKEVEVVHPYLKAIQDSKEFTQKKFWHDISTYLDLEGVYYLMAVRAVGTTRTGEVTVGAVQKFVMLNPYQIRRVRKEADGTIGGYIESREGMYREIPKEMIIEIRLLNPFDNEKPFSMTDAAKEAQFTMKQAGDYTRHSIKGNINSPGAITTDVVLEDHIFDNFVSRIQNHGKGEPLYGNGSGAIKWESMQVDLDKASLDKINEIHRSTLFAVSGTSKTMMGIEESGTGREVSKTQKDDFTENAVMPQIEDIIDALNLDYRKWYKEWEQQRFEILLDNPLESDRDSELKDIEIRTKEYEVTNKLQSLGYEYELAAKYAHGDISLFELGEPTLEPELTDEEAEAIAARELGLVRDEPETDNEPEMANEISEDATDLEPTANKILAINATKGYNPYRDSGGKFDDGLSITDIRGRTKTTREANDKKIDEARKRLKKQASEQKKADKEKRRKEKEKTAKTTAVDKEAAESQNKAIDLGDAKAAEAQKYLNGNYSTTTYNTVQSKAVDIYADLGYTAINDGLRKSLSNTPDPKNFEDASLMQTIQELDKTFNAVTIKEDLITYRGVSNRQNTKLVVGGVINDLGYSSTSLRRDSAEAFLGDTENPYILKISIAKGQNAIIPSLSKTATSVAKHEAEVLLPRDTAYKINKITEYTDALGYKYNLVEVSII